MKISEQSILASNQTSSANKPDKLEFEQWLKTPAKENSGDEYYWQHQEQLQQSRLHFDPAPLAKQPKGVEAAEISKTLVESENHVSPKNPLGLQPIVNAQFQQINSASLNMEVFTRVIICPESKSNQNITPLDTTTNALITEKKVTLEKIEIPVDSQITTRDFKNHHLFIDDQQVELSLNSQDFNSEDEKEFIQIAKNHLKNKGLSLRKLIINGVEND